MVRDISFRKVVCLLSIHIIMTKYLCFKLCVHLSVLFVYLSKFVACSVSQLVKKLALSSYIIIIY